MAAPRKCALQGARRYINQMPFAASYHPTPRYDGFLKKGSTRLSAHAARGRSQATNWHAVCVFISIQASISLVDAILAWKPFHCADPPSLLLVMGAAAVPRGICTRDTWHDWLRLICLQ